MSSEPSFQPVMARMSDADLDTLHEASLEILAETGVNVHSADVRAMLQAAGAEVRDELRVHIPA